jgi:hypothetical protein
MEKCIFSSTHHEYDSLRDSVNAVYNKKTVSSVLQNGVVRYRRYLLKIDWNPFPNIKHLISLFVASCTSANSPESLFYLMQTIDRLILDLLDDQ